MKVSIIILSISLALATFVSHSASLKVLGIFPTFGKSHWNVGNGVMMGLVEAGHEVTVISPFPLKKPIKNYRDIDIEGVLKFREETEKNFDPFSINVKLPALSLFFISKLFDTINPFVFKTPEVQRLLHSNETFDAVIVELFCSEVLLGFGQHFNAPVIALSPFGANKWVNDLVGNPAPSAFIPNPLLSYTQHMTFSERFWNAVFNLYQDVYTAAFHMPVHRRFYSEYFPNAKLTFDEMYSNVSLVFLNTHVSLGHPVPYAPNMIEIGGVNIDRRVKPLPKELETVISSAKHGVIYFSLGSHIRSSGMPKKTLEIFVEAFRQLKQTVLWKLDKPEVIGDNVPKNLHIQQWFPQNEVLAHPNVRFFISHGGLLSTTETVYHGKPIIGVPVLGDQDLNIAKAVQAGFAIRVDYSTITREELDNALNQMLTNSTYSDNVKRISSVYRDQKMTPRETVAYWTEYVVRHKGARHFHSTAVDMSYIVLNNLDVLITMFLAVLITTLLFVMGCLKCLRRNSPRSTSSSQQSKKKRN